MANVLGELFQDIADAIRSKTGSTDTLKPNQFPEAIEGITTGGGEGEKPFDCHSVTFVYNDKSYVRSVADGDTCADPVERGLIPTPTKESTVQYNYTFYGWGASDGGAADANILKNITEDKTVYAIFTATVRYYTVTYLDDDGVTVLNTESLPYGAMPSYKPTKADNSFDGWIPNTAVTGEMTYTASWIPSLDFNAMSWAEIDAAVQAGKAELFSLGATKRFKSAMTNNTYFTVQIVGINHDDLADGSGKAGLTIALRDPYNLNTLWSNSSSAYYNIPWCGDGTYKANITTQMSDFYKYLPTALKNIVKTVTKKRYDTKTGQYVTDDVTMFPPAVVELTGSTSATHRPEEGTQYAWYANADSFGTYYPWTRTRENSTKVYYVTRTGGNDTIISVDQGSDVARPHGLFCI